MQALRKTLLMVAILLGLTGELHATSNYYAEPPFLPAPVSPNVLMVVDVSGSMGWSAYNPRSATDPWWPRAGWCDNAAGCGWTFLGTEEGNWIPTKKYKQVSGVWTETSDAAQACPNRLNDIDSGKTYTGACLNFHLMSRIDLLRWAMTGGRPDVCSDGEYTSEDCDPSIQADASATGYITIHTIYGFKTKVPTSRIDDAVIPQFRTAKIRPRFGLLYYSDSIKSEKVYVGDYPAGATPDSDIRYTYFVRYLNAHLVGGGTGTGPAMWEAYDYFKQSDDHVFTNDFEMADASNRYRDPLYACDFERNADGTVKSYLYNKLTCGIVPCAKNFVILATDGQWNLDTSFNGTCSIDTGFTNNSADPVVPAYKMHHDVLRTVTGATGTTYNKRVDAVYGLGLFLTATGSGTLSLKNTAMYGGYDVTSGGDWPGSLTDYPKSTCTMDDCGAGKGSACTALPATTSPPALAPDWDQDQDGVPDTFINATDGAALRDSLISILNDIVRKTASGSAISVLSERAATGAVVHQALFFPTKTFNSTYTIEWPGTLNAYWYFNTKDAQNIREDNTNNFFLDTLADNVLDFGIEETSGNLEIYYYNTTSLGAKNTELGFYSSIDDVHKIWEGGEKLKNRAGSDRTIYGINESNTLSTFTSANVTLFDGLFGDTTKFPTCLGDATHRATNLIGYTRGESDNFTSATGSTCRTRVVDDDGHIWKLGDIINSTPRLIDYTQYSVLFTGANDGMLHAFQVGKIRKDGLAVNQAVRLCDKNTGTCTTGDVGKELWSFIPKNAMPYLKYLADPEYRHLYVVDLQTYYINDGDQKILIGGMRFGGATGATDNGKWAGDTSNPADNIIDVDADGDLKQIIPEAVGGCAPATPQNCQGLSSYFALDVTNPTNPIFLWEYSNPGLGFSYSGPAWIKRGTKRYVMFGSGPTNYEGEALNQDVKLFILEVNSSFQLVDVHKIHGGNDADDPAGGNRFIKASDITNLNDSFIGRMFTDGVDFNKDGKTDVVYFGINWYTGNEWKGNVVGVYPNDSLPTNGTNTVNWTVKTVFNSGQEPITAKVISGECFGTPYIYFGTGRWFYKLDTPGTLNGSDINSLYGVAMGDCKTAILAGETNLDQKCGNFQTAHSSHIDECPDASPGNTAWQLPALLPNDGTYMKERLISDPSFSDNMIFFTTAQPSADLCAFGGQSRIFALNCASGDDIFSQNCPGYIVSIPAASLLLQLSGGNIEDTQLNTTSLSEAGNKATEWFVGMPPESGATFLPPAGLRKGKMILWIER